MTKDEILIETNILLNRLDDYYLSFVIEKSFLSSTCPREFKELALTNMDRIIGIIDRFREELTLVNHSLTNSIVPINNSRTQILFIEMFESVNTFLEKCDNLPETLKWYKGECDKSK